MIRKKKHLKFQRAKTSYPFIITKSVDQFICQILVSVVLMCNMPFNLRHMMHFLSFIHGI